MDSKTMMHKIKHLLIASLFAIFGLQTADAQQLQGIVYDLETSQTLSEVEVRNLRTGEKTQTDLQGNFTIGAGINDYLSFLARNYERDTAFIYQEGVNRIYLVRDNSSIRIDEVVVSKITDSRLTKEIEKAELNSQAVETSQNRGGLRISPSRLFGREAKQARASIKILQEERESRQVDRVFTNEFILSLIPMEKDELALFRDGYRPSYEFVQQAAKEDLTAYVIEAYAKFKKRQKPTLKK